MNNDKIEKKLDQLIELMTKQLAYSMFEAGHTMDEISKSLHVGKQTVVKILEGLEKKKKQS